MNFPIYRAFVSEDDKDKAEVNYIALVDKPAIESNFFAFDMQQNFAVTNEDERIITGLAMIADKPIYRRDKQGEYFIYFDAPSIKTIALRFFRKQYNYHLNLNHDPKQRTEDVYIFESWIVDRAKGKSPMEQFADVSDGSWIISAKIDDDNIWSDVKSGKFKGFSVEGMFKTERTAVITDSGDIVEQLKKILQDVEL